MINYSSSQQPVYLDAKNPVSRRVEDLLSRMTLEEKIGQMNMPCVYENGLGEGISEKTEACWKLTEGKVNEFPGPAGGFFTLANKILHLLNIRIRINKIFPENFW